MTIPETLRRFSITGRILLLAALLSPTALRAEAPTIFPAAPATNTPIVRGFLQSDLNGNGQAITNASFVGNGAGLTNLVGAALPVINGSVYYVSPGGNDHSAVAGRRDKPWRSVATAATAAACGRTNVIYVEAGSYNESNNVYLTPCNSLVGEGRDATIINLYGFTNSPMGDWSAMTVVSNTTVSGVTINMPLTNSYEWIGVGDVNVDYGSTGTGIAFYDCNLNGTSDIFFLEDFAAAEEITVVNCRISSKWDTFANTGYGGTVTRKISLQNTEFIYDHTYRPAKINGHDYYTPAVFNMLPYVGEINMQNCVVRFINTPNCAFAAMNPESPADLSLVLKGLSMYAPATSTNTLGPDSFISAFTNTVIADVSWQAGNLQKSISTPDVTFAGKARILGSGSFGGPFLTNAGVVWWVTNNTPAGSLPNGSICTVTDGRQYYRSNNTWILH